MTQQAFAAAALGWHDFFLAAAGASAALLGLLFVGVSINLAALAAEERVDLRARAGQAFANPDVRARDRPHPADSRS
jgi:hypothetical protein